MYRMDCACGAGALGWRLLPSHPPLSLSDIFPDWGPLGQEEEEEVQSVQLTDYSVVVNHNYPTCGGKKVVAEPHLLPISSFPLVIPLDHHLVHSFIISHEIKVTCLLAWLLTCLPHPSNPRSMRVKSWSPRFPVLCPLWREGGRGRTKRKKKKQEYYCTLLCTCQGVRKRWDCMNTTRDRGRLRVREW